MIHPKIKLKSNPMKFIELKQFTIKIIIIMELIVFIIFNFLIHIFNDINFKTSCEIKIQ
ncbi:hypothetical protein PROVRETT_07180 [Providencia rettgeri DSM 1131]|nr:hypothetical protein PROVRETT_07180 [Providencia rettgeri DSM 1131]BBU94407.1 hypothetical protein BML2496_02900 [Providencia rettgeri]